MKAILKIVLFVALVIYLFLAVEYAARGQAVVGYGPVRGSFLNQLYIQGVLRPPPVHPGLVGTYQHTEKAGPFGGGGLYSRTIVDRPPFAGNHPPYPYYTYHAYPARSVAIRFGSRRRH